MSQITSKKTAVSRATALTRKSAGSVGSLNVYGRGINQTTNKIGGVRSGSMAHLNYGSSTNPNAPNVLPSQPPSQLLAYPPPNVTSTRSKSKSTTKLLDTPEEPPSSFNFYTQEEEEIPLTEAHLGELVWIKGTQQGILRFLGKTQFKEGIWCGVECDSAVGKNDGSVNGVRYFTCEENFGIFAPHSVVSLVNMPSNFNSKKPIIKSTTKTTTTCTKPSDNHQNAHHPILHVHPGGFDSGTVATSSSSTSYCGSDPMTDSDFNTESEADHEGDHYDLSHHPPHDPNNHIPMKHRNARVIDGALYTSHLNNSLNSPQNHPHLHNPHVNALIRSDCSSMNSSLTGGPKGMDMMSSAITASGSSTSASASEMESSGFYSDASASDRNLSGGSTSDSFSVRYTRGMRHLSKSSSDCDDHVVVNLVNNTFTSEDSGGGIDSGGQHDINELSKSDSILDLQALSQLDGPMDELMDYLDDSVEDFSVVETSSTEAEAPLSPTLPLDVDGDLCDLVNQSQMGRTLFSTSCAGFDNSLNVTVMSGNGRGSYYTTALKTPLVEEEDGNYSNNAEVEGSSEESTSTQPGIAEEVSVQMSASTTSSLSNGTCSPNNSTIAILSQSLTSNRGDAVDMTLWQELRDEGFFQSEEGSQKSSTNSLENAPPNGEVPQESAPEVTVSTVEASVPSKSILSPTGSLQEKSTTIPIVPEAEEKQKDELAILPNKLKLNTNNKMSLGRNRSQSVNCIASLVKSGKLGGSKRDLRPFDSKAMKESANANKKLLEESKTQTQSKTNSNDKEKEENKRNKVESKRENTRAGGTESSVLVGTVASNSRRTSRVLTTNLNRNSSSSAKSSGGERSLNSSVLSTTSNNLGKSMGISNGSTRSLASVGLSSVGSKSPAPVKRIISNKWDGIMSKINETKDKKINVRDVKSKVFDSLKSGGGSGKLSNSKRSVGKSSSRSNLVVVQQENDPLVNVQLQQRQNNHHPFSSRSSDSSSDSSNEDHPPRAPPPSKYRAKKEASRRQRSDLSSASEYSATHSQRDVSTKSVRPPLPTGSGSSSSGVPASVKKRAPGRLANNLNGPNTPTPSKTNIIYSKPQTVVQVTKINNRTTLASTNQATINNSSSVTTNCANADKTNNARKKNNTAGDNAIPPVLPTKGGSTKSSGVTTTTTTTRHSISSKTNPEVKPLRDRNRLSKNGSSSLEATECTSAGSTNSQSDTNVKGKGQGQGRLHHHRVPSLGNEKGSSSSPGEIIQNNVNNNNHQNSNGSGGNSSSLNEEISRMALVIAGLESRIKSVTQDGDQQREQLLLRISDLEKATGALAIVAQNCDIHREALHARLLEETASANASEGHLHEKLLEIDSLRTELDRERECHKEEVAQVVKDHEAQLSRLVNDHYAQTAELRKSHEDGISDVKKGYVEEIEKLKELHRLELEQTNKRHRELLEEHRKQSPHDLLVKEVESLEAVLEMRNGEIRDLRKELIDYRNTIDCLQLTKEQVRTLQAKVEDLEAQLEKARSDKRLLQEKYREIENNLNNLESKNVHLSQCNEELSWKIQTFTPESGKSPKSVFNLQQQLQGNLSNNSSTLSSNNGGSSSADEDYTPVRLSNLMKEFE